RSPSVTYYYAGIDLGGAISRSRIAGFSIRQPSLVFHCRPKTQQRPRIRFATERCFATRAGRVAGHPAAPQLQAKSENYTHRHSLVPRDQLLNQSPTILLPRKPLALPLPMCRSVLDEKVPGIHA